MPPNETPQPAAAAAIVAASRNQALPVAGGESLLDTAGVDVRVSEEVEAVGLGDGQLEEVTTKTDDAMVSSDEVEAADFGDGSAMVSSMSTLPRPASMPPNETPQPAAASRNQALPVVGGESLLDTAGVDVRVREEVGAVGLGDGQLEEEMAKTDDGMVSSDDVETMASWFQFFDLGDDSAMGDTADVEVTKNEIFEEPDESKEKNALKLKLSKKLRLRSLWAGFMNRLEEEEYKAAEDSLNAENVSLQTLKNLLDNVKQMEKLIKKRCDEFKNRDASVESLTECINKLRCDHILAELHEADILKAQVLLTEKLEKQRRLQKYEDPVLLCSHLDNLRKKLQKPIGLAAEDFKDSSIEDIIFSPSRNDFRSFIGHLCNRLIDNEQHEKIKESYLLPYQRNGLQPPKWLRIHLLGREKDKVSIYLRSDNGYFIAFENQNGIFELGPGSRSEHSRLIPDSTFVQCDFDYPSMMNFERSAVVPSSEVFTRRLLDLIFHVEAMLDDIRILSNYKHPLPPPPDGAIIRFQIALARTTITICEVCRIIGMLTTIEDGWITGARLSKLLLNYIWRWSDVSGVLRSWRFNKYRKFPETLHDLFGMVYAEEAADVIFLVLNSKGAYFMFEQHDQPGDGGDNDDPNEFADKSNITQQPPQGPTAPSGDTGNSQQQPLQGPVAPGGDTNNSQQQPPQSRPLDSTSNEDATSSSCSTSTNLDIQILRRYAVCSPSRGLIDLITHASKATAVSSSLGVGLALYGSKSKAVYNRKRKCSIYPSQPGFVPRGSNPPAMKRLIGQPLVEIFEMCANFPFVGTVMVCDGRSSKTIYCREDWNQTYCEFFSRRDEWVSSGNAAVDFKDNLKLIGPSRATTAHAGFAIQVYTPATRRKAREVCRLSCDMDDLRLYNQLKTYTIKTNRGCLYVTCSVLAEAMEGYVNVRLQVPSHWRGLAFAKIYGLITAQIGKFDTEITLFSKDLKEAARVVVEASEITWAQVSQSLPFGSFREGYNLIKVPLTRSILAVPLGEDLHIKGKLQICGYGAKPIIIDHTIPLSYEYSHTLWRGKGESSSAVSLCLRPIF